MTGLSAAAVEVHHGARVERADAAEAGVRRAVRPRARAVLAAGSKSFALAARLLPRRARDDAAVCYAYSRRADDLIDDADEPGASAHASAQPRTLALARLRAELNDIYTGAQLADPVQAAFQELVRRRRIPRAYPDALLDGFAMDAGDAAYPDLAALELYAFRVAGAVGLMMAHVLGVRDERSLIAATHMGMAMQLTNVCRDVAEDWERGRLYLPAALLGGPLAVTGPRPPDSLRALFASAVRTLLARAELYYRSGRRGLRALPWRSALAIRAASLIYARIGGVLARREHDVLGPRAVVPTTTKLMLVPRALLGTLAEIPARLGAWFGGRRRFTIPTTTLRYPDDIPRPSGLSG